MNKSLYTPKFSFGKWCFLFIGGIILFTIAYAFATIPELYIGNNWISGTISFIYGVLLLLMYRWLVGSYEDRKIDELSMRKCLRHTGIGLLWGVLMMAAIIVIFAMSGWYKVVGCSFNARKHYLAATVFNKMRYLANNLLRRFGAYGACACTWRYDYSDKYR